MKQIIPIILLIFLINLASAVFLIAGESYTFQINTTNELFYDVINNQSDLNGLVITQDIFDDYSNITISTDILYKADSFTLIFFEIQEKVKEVVKEVSVGGGGGGGETKIIEKKKYVKIPKYIDREIEVIKEVENTEKINILKKEILDKNKIIILLSLLSFTLLIFLLLYKIFLTKHLKGKELLKN